MSFSIVRNDITKMNTEAIVNTANSQVAVGTGCDSAVYRAAGYDELLAYRKEKIGVVPEGEVFITPGFGLQAEYIIHAVSPLYTDGNSGEEEKLRSCYAKSLKLAKEHGIRSIAFPLISSGSFGYPKEEAMRIAADEINAFLLTDDMEIILVVFDEYSNSLGKKLFPELEEYIDRNYVDEKQTAEYECLMEDVAEDMEYSALMPEAARIPEPGKRAEKIAKPRGAGAKLRGAAKESSASFFGMSCNRLEAAGAAASAMPAASVAFFETDHESRLNERIKHTADTFTQYLLYLIQEKGLENSEVYKRAIVDKKVFSKIKNNVDYHPQKLTVLCLCIGAKLNLDESKDLLARAGYALSPCDKTDIIFSYFIENGIYDMIELDIQLEEHGLPCIIS